MRHVEWRALREIEVGICDGLTYDQVKVKFPEEYRARMQDKLKYRYPRGESYMDVITRLEVRLQCGCFGTLSLLCFSVILLPIQFTSLLLSLLPVSLTFLACHF